MRYLKWTFWLVFVICIGGFLHYTLPQNDIVRIVGTDTRRVDIGWNSMFWGKSEIGMANSTSRDVFFINAVYPDGKTMDYRNEDTGWGWPPYFKINSYDLQTKAKELASTKENPIWVKVSHYGWRSNFMSIFPNALSVAQVAGPDVRVIPWMAIIILAFLAFLGFMAYRFWLSFQAKVIDPIAVRMGRRIDKVEDMADDVATGTRGFFARIKGWFGRK